MAYNHNSPFAMEATPHLKFSNTLSLHSSRSGSGAVDHKIIASVEVYDPACYDLFIDPVGSIGKMRFKCGYFGCKDGTFDEIQKARKHVAEHYFLKPFICKCGAAYKNKGDADRHAAPPSVCQYCLKRLTRKDGQTKHEKICKKNPANSNL
ncbi:hypothetical protein JB92DRAFT_383789 [Gautieria morchelliformis]|nr:hypothetical protein JB92DRAFT_383789 [Gautieria morchelliformis]